MLVKGKGGNRIEEAPFMICSVTLHRRNRRQRAQEGLNCTREHESVKAAVKSGGVADVREENKLSFGLVIIKKPLRKSDEITSGHFKRQMWK